MHASARLLPFPLTALFRTLGIALLAFDAAPAEAQIENWSASGEVSMTYRTQPAGTVYGRNAATISETVATDIISTIEVGGTSGPSDDDPGDLDLVYAGEEGAPRNIGDVDVNVGTFSLNSSIVTGRIDVTRPTGVVSMQLSATGPGMSLNVRDGGTLTAQASHVSASVTGGGIARVSGITGSLSSGIGADIEIDASTAVRRILPGQAGPVRTAAR